MVLEANTNKFCEIFKKIPPPMAHSLQCSRMIPSFFNMVPSFKVWETHQCLKNRLGIVYARGEGLLDYPYAPCHPPSVHPTEEHLVGHLTNYCHQINSCGLYILFLSNDSVLSLSYPRGPGITYNNPEISGFYLHLMQTCDKNNWIRVKRVCVSVDTSDVSMGVNFASECSEKCV